MSHAADGTSAAGKRRGSSTPGWVRRHKVLSAVIAAALVLVLGTGGYLAMLNTKFADIDRFGLSLSEEDRPDPAPGKAMNILLLGADAGKTGSQDIRKDAAKDEWPSGTHRSDTVMVLHISANREDVTLISLPRDLYVDVHDEHGQPQGKNKINAAFSYHGPSGALSTVEHLTGLRMNHLAIVDWDGFKDLTRAVDGARVYIPRDVYDQSQDITWQKGWHDLEGKRALAYVRTREGLENGDLGRIERQQNFVRTVMKKLLSNDTLNHPTQLSSALEALTGNMAVDKGFSTGDIRGLALSMRGLEANDVEFVTAPTNGFATAENGASVVEYDRDAGKQLFTALRRDRDLTSYVEDHPSTQLSGSHKVD